MTEARQGDLFSHDRAALRQGLRPAAALPLLQQTLLDWQQRLAAHQGPLFAGSDKPAHRQVDLFAPLSASRSASDAIAADDFDPLKLQRQPLSFWRWPQAKLRGPALYVVLDQPAALSHPLLLYVGETARAEQRWKGEHDCKGYLAAYGDALQKAALTTQLSIAFCSDVPAQTRERRALEQGLIRRWLPPFNKETRGRWATPFQAEPG